MKIDCLMGTHGRHTLACEALACFLQQSAISQATLLIYNQHPVPLRFDHPRVRIVNEAPPAGSLRHVRQRMHELADPSAELIHWWDDDDLYLPWHLEDCLEHIAGHVAWKPASSWISEGNVKFSRLRNTFEASWVFRSDYLKSAALDTHPTYTDHPVIRQTEEAKLLATTELAGRTSYIYRWANGMEHVSAYGGAGSEETQRDNLGQWRRRSCDIGADGTLVPADLTLRWQQYLVGTKGLVTSREHVLNRRGLRPSMGRVRSAERKVGDRAGACRGRYPAGRAGRAKVTAAGLVHVAAAARTRAAGAVEQCQLAAEVLQHHFGGIAVLAGLILPFARLQRAFDVNLRAFLEILLGDLAQILVEDHDPVPLGLFTPLAGRLVLPVFRGGEPQICNRPPILGATDFGIGAEIADQDHLVDASRHDLLRFIAHMSCRAACLVRAGILSRTARSRSRP